MIKEYSNWKEYQKKVAEFFKREGCNAEIEVKVEGVRSRHDVDVYVNFYRLGLDTKWIVECKLWNKKVNKEKVLALKSIVDDVGADRGLLFCENGFQPGAYSASKGTNITLVTSLEEFERTAQIKKLSKNLILVKNTTSEFLTYKFPNSECPKKIIEYNDLLYVANWKPGSICIVSSQKKKIQGEINLDNYELLDSTKQRKILRYPPGDFAIANDKIFIGQTFSEFIVVVDMFTSSIVKRIKVDGGGEGKLTTSRDGKTIFFASNRKNIFYMIDSASYEYEIFPYPLNGRGCMSIYAHPNGAFLYIGIQRGGISPGKGSFIAVYDLYNKDYLKQIYLEGTISGRYDISSPCCMVYDEIDQILYVAMFQSCVGIYMIDTVEHKIIGNISFNPNSHNVHSKSVDPLSLKIYKNYLLSINRNNRELAIINKHTKELVKTIYLGEAQNGPYDIALTEKDAIVCYPERHELLFFNLDKLFEP